MTQLAAAALDLPIENVRFELGDSSFPMAPMDGGSWLTSSVGPAVRSACDALKTKLAKLAAADKDGPLKRAKPDDLAMTGGRLVVVAEPTRGALVGDILKRAGVAQIEADGSAKPGKNGEDKYAHHSFGAAFAEVTVDPDLGQVRLARFVGVYDAGRILNPQLARSQIIGGTIFGLSMALQEHGVPDPGNGRTVNANLAEYHIPVCADMPEGGFDISFLNEPDPHFGGEQGAHGIGELGIVGSVAAIANAVFHASGKRVRDLPITLDKLILAVAPVAYGGLAFACAIAEFQSVALTPMNPEIEPDGFVVIPDAIDAVTRRDLLAALGPVSSAGRRGLLASPAVAALACSARLLDLVRPHLPSEPRPVRSLLRQVIRGELARPLAPVVTLLRTAVSSSAATTRNSWLCACP